MKGRKPTADESRHMSAVVALGCIACRLDLDQYTPAEIHHTAGKTKLGAHFKVLGLCQWHHRDGKDVEWYTSRHPYKKRFEARYGTEAELLEKTRELLDR